MLQQFLLLTLTALIGAGGGWGVTLISRQLMQERGREAHWPEWLPALCAAVGAVLALLALWQLGLTPRLAYLFLVTLLWAAVALVDLSCRLIPNQLILALLAITAVFALAGWIPFDWRSSLLGLGCCLLLFLLPALLGKQIGLGDVKLAAAMGFASGLVHACYTIALMGVFLLGLTLLQRGLPLAQRLKRQAPLGPYMAAAFLVVQAGLW